MSDSPKRPFEKGALLSSGIVEGLLDWLDKYGHADAVLGGEYTVADLMEDLSSAVDGMWSDGIDAMGEDA